MQTDNQYCGIFPESRGTLLGNDTVAAVTSFNNEAAAGSSVFHMIRHQANSDATVGHVTQCLTHQQNNCKNCFLRGLPRAYMRRASGRCELVWSSEIVSGSAGRWCWALARRLWAE
jgi:hypothetical protein